MTRNVTGFWKADQIVTLGLYAILLAQLMATRIHYPPLSGLADWSTFWSEFCQPCKFMTETVGPIKGMGLKLTPVVVRHLRPMAGTS